MRLPQISTALISLAFLCMSFTFYSLQSYEIAEDYAVKFSTKGADGTFADLMGTVVFDPSHLEASKFDVSVATASIETGNKTQNKHAKGDSWLDAEANPRISFVSSAFNKTNGGYAVSGDLTIHGVTKTVAIPFLFENSTFSGSLTVLREDFEIKGPFLFGGFVGDEIEVSLRVPVK
jgi:polyisoprenoid-binding protein YceI